MSWFCHYPATMLGGLRGLLPPFSPIKYNKHQLTHSSTGNSNFYYYLSPLFHFLKYNLFFQYYQYKFQSLYLPIYLRLLLISSSIPSPSHQAILISQWPHHHCYTHSQPVRGASHLFILHNQIYFKGPPQL